MTPEQAGCATRRAVDALGPAFLEDPRTLRRARELGLTGWACYVAGRGGALGDVRPETVAAALGLIAPEAVHDAWAAARAVLAPSKVAEEMLTECRRWGTERLDGAPGVRRLVVLAEAVVVAADASAFPLFAAWRAMPSADDGPGARAAVALHLLHEHRAGALLLGIRAGGLTPLQALIAGPEGERSAAANGWQPPYPKRAQLLRRRAWADAVADHLAGQALRVLDGRQRAELVVLLRDAAAHARRA